jgi:SAM-dependent methyltransferase
MAFADTTFDRFEPHPAGGRGWGYDEVAAAILADLGPGFADRPLAVLEAGGGSATHLPLPRDARVTTIDISAEALARNTTARECLLGDLQTFDFGTRRFDLVICWDVLEHLADPGAALDRLSGALDPGGRIIVVGPLPWSLKGLVTRLTPHALHVQFYRRILGSVSAGRPGHPPFPTHHAAGADPAQIAHRLATCGLVIDITRRYESRHVEALAARSRWLLAAYRFGETLLHGLSRGRIAPGATDFYMIARRPHAG